MDRTRLRRAGLEATAVLLPAFIAVLGHPSFWWSVPAALLSCALLPLRHVWPPLAVFGVLPGLAGGLGWAPALVALYMLGRRSRSLAEAAPWLLAPVVAAVAPVFATQALPWQDGVLTVGYVVVNAGAATVVGLLVGTRARLVESLRQLDEARETALEARGDAARAEERARIGREIHDAVGHHITLIAVGAAALAASTREEHTRSAADQLRLLAKRSLGEVRAALGLAGGPVPQPAPEPDMASSVGVLVADWRAAGMDVELADRGVRTGLCPIVERAASRVVQEALTNAARHAPGSQVRVELGSSADALRVCVRNTAAPTPRDVVGRGGAGLAGLAERSARWAGGSTSAPAPTAGSPWRRSSPSNPSRPRPDQVTDRYPPKSPSPGRRRTVVLSPPGGRIRPSRRCRNSGDHGSRVPPGVGGSHDRPGGDGIGGVVR